MTDQMYSEFPLPNTTLAFITLLERHKNIEKDMKFYFLLKRTYNGDSAKSWKSSSSRCGLRTKETTTAIIIGGLFM